MKLNKREKNLIKILLILIIVLVVNVMSRPLEENLTNLKKEKQNIVNEIKRQDNYKMKDKKHKDNRYVKNVELDSNTELKNNFNNSFLDKKTNKDIVLLVENELRDIVSVEYINQESSLDNYNKKQTNLEVKVNGELENVLKLEGVMKNLKLHNKIEKIEINKLKTSNLEVKNLSNEYKQEKSNLVECKMTIRVT
ncbi:MULTISPECIES: hypothetical protein [unclassified Clostridioides]|uniref:hypothetical protein n=1 Tax=unclassified Clostridioides TaxID=2635829 RepID=UPI001D0F76AA|nr:hypothetical protein [Clostridioides sp. ZZV15-6388]MCC0645992.1 hypothetical protein [Clostridioides sp. ZZV14-6150]MCC0664720.1 hypothetical protein [Clostridioides sp. ZZV15-6597]MCC0719845.1 hypothetical protein [Clostridioides sp. ZZV14-6105]MCC0723852.1 hypothetical protein [Clostridioides sp. ZZV14-6104]MCC0727468.1 hypothetical protein [Clostridioides sp. ZZV14-6045]MCC0730470.1 hypothetical protein [Clostridioides sp. ZZV14-6048]MCC0736098.1 hypothetical protein [Clostridioides s